MISVIIPARNAAATIATTIASLAADRAVIGEILLADDGSDDCTSTVAETAAGTAGLPLNILRGEFGGAGAARNAGLAAARQERIFFLDADDEVFPGALTLLAQALSRDTTAGLAVGAVLRRTANRPDKLKVPSGYGADLGENARRYLRNELLPIAMGSALFVVDPVRDIAFPTTIALDEDSCYWAALLTRLPVVAMTTPVLLYHLDEQRMEDRFVSAPRSALLRISLELDRLRAFGVERAVLQWRKAWVALRIARLLIMHRRYPEAKRMLRMALAHPDFRFGWKAFQYRARIAAGRMAQAAGLCLPMRRPSASLRPPLRTMVLTYDPACPAISGADLRNNQNAMAVRQLGPAMLVSVRPAETTVRNDIAVAALTLDGEPRGRPISRRRTAVERRVPTVALSRLLRLVRQFQPDVIVVEGIGLSAFLEPLRPLSRRLILDMHNVESDLYRQAQSDESPGGKILHRWRAGCIRRQEARAMRLVDRVWVCSDADRQRLRQIAPFEVPIDVVMNGIPRTGQLPESLPELPGQTQGWPTMLFIGHLGYAPNVDACKRLAENILPKVRRHFPEARLILAGRYPKPAVTALAALPGLEVVANPDNLAPLFARSHVSVVPLSTGGGTRIKILEAMAWGLPVIATPIAAEGLGLTPDDDFLIRDSDEELAEAVVGLCGNPVRMEELRATAHARVMRLYGPSSIADAVRKGIGLAASRPNAFDEPANEVP